MPPQMPRRIVPIGGIHKKKSSYQRDQRMSDRPFKTTKVYASKQEQERRRKEKEEEEEGKNRG